jgi:hypothetical protein
LFVLVLRSQDRTQVAKLQVEVMSIPKILDCWGRVPMRQLLRNVPDSEVVAVAAQAAILLGKRAQEQGRKDIEQACREFVEFLNEERADTSYRTYRMKP